MSQKIIQTDLAPAPVGPYSQAVRVGEFLFCSGQIPLDPKTGVLLTGDIKAQTRRVLENLRAVLKQGGMDFHNVVKTTIFLVKMSDFAQVNEVYSEIFGEAKPARSTVEVSALPKGAEVEIELVAAQ